MVWHSLGKRTVGVLHGSGSYVMVGFVNLGGHDTKGLVSRLDRLVIIKLRYFEAKEMHRQKDGIV